MSLKVLQIVPGTSVDGPGLRTSVYLAGCSHACPGCHNPASWDFNGGEEMSPDQVAEIVISHGFNMTLTGGDPLLHSDLDAVERLICLVKARGKTVWLYTGFVYEQIINIPRLNRIIRHVDAIVDGPFIQSQLTRALPFRGSANQHILHSDGTPFDLDL